LNPLIGKEVSVSRRIVRLKISYCPISNVPRHSEVSGRGFERLVC
jgi:hypothetical protein